VVQSLWALKGIVIGAAALSSKRANPAAGLVFTHFKRYVHWEISVGME
jgi:hypothetical protein